MKVKGFRPCKAKYPVSTVSDLFSITLDSNRKARSNDEKSKLDDLSFFSNLLFHAAEDGRNDNSKQRKLLELHAELSQLPRFLKSGEIHSEYKLTSKLLPKLIVKYRPRDDRDSSPEKPPVPKAPAFA